MSLWYDHVWMASVLWLTQRVSNSETAFYVERLDCCLALIVCKMCALSKSHSERSTLLLLLLHSDIINIWLQEKHACTWTKLLFLSLENLCMFQNCENCNHWKAHLNWQIQLYTMKTRQTVSILSVSSIKLWLFIYLWEWNVHKLHCYHLIH